MQIPYPPISIVLSFLLALSVLLVAPLKLDSLTVVSLDPIYIAPPPPPPIILPVKLPATAPKPVVTPAPSPRPTTPPAPRVSTGPARYPARLLIPAVGISSPIIGVGVNAKGEMAVPSGSSNNVGWWKDGTIPGENGTAVLDAHVFAAFQALDQVKIGDNIYVERNDGSKLHFVVVDVETYALNAMTSRMLFGEDGTPRLNLITCAGTLTPDHSTYDHRLVVYTKLVQ